MLTASTIPSVTSFTLFTSIGAIARNAMGGTIECFFNAAYRPASVSKLSTININLSWLYFQNIMMIVMSRYIVGTTTIKTNIHLMHYRTIIFNFPCIYSSPISLWSPKIIIIVQAMQTSKITGTSPCSTRATYKPRTAVLSLGMVLKPSNSRSLATYSSFTGSSLTKSVDRYFLLSSAMNFTITALSPIADPTMTVLEDRSIPAGFCGNAGGIR